MEGREGGGRKLLLNTQCFMLCFIASHGNGGEEK